MRASERALGKTMKRGPESLKQSIKSKKKNFVAVHEA